MQRGTAYLNECDSQTLLVSLISEALRPPSVPCPNSIAMKLSWFITLGDGYDKACVQFEAITVCNSERNPSWCHLECDSERTKTVCGLHVMG